MPRPPMMIETWGKIRRATVDGQPIAYAYFRDASGRRKQIQRNGRTEAAAERNLIAALKEKFEQSGEGDLLTSESTVANLAAKYLEELELKKTVAGTFNTYRNSIRSKILPGIGALRLREATVPRLDQFIKSMLVTPSSARTARTVLLQMFALAVRHGAVARNPAADTMPVPSKRNEVKVISLTDIHHMRELFADYDRSHTSELAEISALLMATGCRIGEALALRWDDVDLGDGILRVTGTLSNDSATGGLFRQEHPKSDAGRRGLRIPRTVINMLAERRVAAIDEMVFPSSTGTYRWPANTRRSWRQALEGSIYRGKTPRDFRKAVATHLDRQVGIKAAQQQLGHGSDDITTKFYVERQEAVADFAEVIETMFESTG